MNKKAQFYILTMLLLTGFVITINAEPFKIKKPTTKFEELYKNYLVESSKAINSALAENVDINARFKNFTTGFVNYAATKDPNFKLLYILRNNGTVDVGNYLRETVNVTTNTTNSRLAGSTNLIVDDTGYIGIVSGSNKYDFNLGEGIQLKALFKSVNDKGTNIYIKK